MSNKNPYQKWDFVLVNGEGGIRSLNIWCCKETIQHLRPFINKRNLLVDTQVFHRAKPFGITESFTTI